jgi:thymidylate kinase
VRRGYLGLAAVTPRIVVIDASGSPDEVGQAVIAATRNRLGELHGGNHGLL